MRVGISHENRKQKGKKHAFRENKRSRRDIDSVVVVEIENYLSNIRNRRQGHTSLAVIFFFLKTHDKSNFCIHIRKRKQNEKGDSMEDYGYSSWIYETGKFEPDVLSSGGTHSHVYKTKDKTDALAHAVSPRNYLVRYYKEPSGRTVSEQYDPHTKTWF